MVGLDPHEPSDSGSDENHKRELQPIPKDGVFIEIRGDVEHRVIDSGIAADWRFIRHGMRWIVRIHVGYLRC